MKKTIIILLFCLFPSMVMAAQICDQSQLTQMPILSQGRVKPLCVHAKETLKYLSGKSDPFKESSVMTYCFLSLSDYLNQPEKKLKIKIEHEKVKEFFGLDKAETGVDPNVVMEKLMVIQSYVHQLENNGASKGLVLDFKKLLDRTQKYFALVSGQDWQVYQNDSWQPVTDYLKSHDVLSLYKTAKEYELKDSHYKIELWYHQLHLVHIALLISLLALMVVFVCHNIKNPAIIVLAVSLFMIETMIIVFRGLISERFPIANMYETMMWAGFGGLFFGLLLGFKRKEKIFLLLGLLLNTFSLFMMMFASNMLDSSIQPLVPVLRNNFWLATHVTSITVSYAALALSWLIANYYMVKFIVKGMSYDEGKYFNKLAYAALKIGVILLAAGILLGAVWADYSWGRFWGWDPKETWSLIALLSYMLVLHGKYAHWIKDEVFLVYVALAFMTIIMAWFGVNFILASGLHSYGFSSGGTLGILSLFFVQVLLVGVFFIKLKAQSSKLKGK